jgi:hypothetical protein
VDAAETHNAPGLTQSFWGLNNDPANLSNPDDVIFVVALMENDDGNPEVLRGFVKGIVASSLQGSFSAARPGKVANLIQDVNSVLKTPTSPRPNLDDQVGAPQELRFSAGELAAAESGPNKIGKDLIFAGDDGHYTLTFEIPLRLKLSAPIRLSARSERNGSTWVQSTGYLRFRLDLNCPRSTELVARSSFKVGSCPGIQRSVPEVFGV